jgi:hypothetical protein
LSKRVTASFFLVVLGLGSVARADFRVASFSADVTVPPGHGMMGGAWLSKSVADPLEAQGLVLLGGDRPVVFVSVDWCEIRNGSYDAWQRALADAAQTEPSHVLVTTIHQHDAPVADVDAEKILRDKHREGTVCDPDFHAKALARVAQALRSSLPAAKRVTHFGMGQSIVDKVASNRRYHLPDGSLRFDRMSRSTDPVQQSAGEDLTDPWLRLLSFWDHQVNEAGEVKQVPVAGVSLFAVHPMSYYGQGEVSADFPGLARRRLQKEMPGIAHLYATGCAGNVVAGKYNDGTPRSREELADRLYRAMAEAWKSTKQLPIEQITFRSTPLRLEPRTDPGYSPQELEKTIDQAPKPFDQCLAAMGLAWRRRLDAGHQLQIPCIDLGRAALLLLPGESYVEYQLLAQRMRSDDFILVAGYGEAGTGYIPTEDQIQRHDPNLSDWWWVAPGSEPRLSRAIRRSLGLPRPGLPPWKGNEPIILSKRERYRAHAEPGVASLVSMFETGPQGERIEVQAWERESDVPDQPRQRFSTDAGQSWSEFVPLPPTIQHYAGVPVWEGGFTKVWDPHRSQLVELWLRQITQGAMYHCFTYARFSRDGGRTWSTPHPLQYEPGEPFDPKDPLKPSFLDHNQAYFGSNILPLSDGTLFTVTAHANASQDPLNHQRPWRLGSVPFRGVWDEQAGDYQWQAGKPIEISADRSSRGLMEPACGQLQDRRLLVVYRGSDTPSTPGRKWYSLSTDQGKTLSPARPWTYDDGTEFASPSSIHSFHRHRSTGKLYWFGNITLSPTQANDPRYPLIVAEVDETTATLKKESLTAIDDRLPWEHPQLQLSNFSILENPHTGDWELWLTRYFEDPSHVFSADTYHYLVRLR